MILSKLEGFWVDSEDNLMHAVASRITFICPMSFNSFPMDVQVCVFQVGSFNYATNKLIFRDEFIPEKAEAIRSEIHTSIFYFLQFRRDPYERLPVIQVRISDISTDFIQVHLGLRHQHLPAAGGGHELHRPQHELQRGRLPAGALQVCSVAIPRPLYCLVFIFRKASFYIVTYYLPSGLFVVVSWISFLINPEVSHSHSLTIPSVPTRTS